MNDLNTAHYNIACLRKPSKRHAASKILFDRRTYGDLKFVIVIRLLFANCFYIYIYIENRYAAESHCRGRFDAQKISDVIR